MRFIEGWQKLVHARNVEKGFYDYKKDIELIEKALQEEKGTSCWELGFGSQIVLDATTRLVADYKKAMIERKLLLVIGELVEAHEELRNGHATDEVYVSATKTGKPEGFPVEMADAEIRLLDVMESLGLDTEKYMTLKHDYNRSRPYKHGRQF